MKKILFIIFLLIAAPCFGANHYITSGGAGVEDGSDFNNAFDGIPSILTRGDTYYVAGGAYGSGVVFDDAISGTDYIYIKKATATTCSGVAGWQASYGTDQAVFTSTSGNAVSFKTSYYDWDGQVGGGPSSWTSGHGFKIITTAAATNAACMIIQDAGSSTYVPDHIHIYHTEMQGQGVEENPNNSNHHGTLCVGLGPSTGSAFSSGSHEFAYNYIHDAPTVNIWGYIPGSLIIEYNYVSTNGNSPSPQGAGITIYGQDTVIYRYNVFREFTGSCGLCLYTWHGDFDVKDVSIYGNIFTGLNNLGNGIISTDGADAAQGLGRTVENIIINNNTFANIQNATRTWYIDSDYEFQSGNVAYNNILFKTEGIGTDDGNFNGFTHDYNFFYLNTDYRNGLPPSTAWDTDEPNAQNGTSDPFVDEANENYALAIETAAGNDTIGATYETDMLGNTRGADGNWDRGAIEYILGSITGVLLGDDDNEDDVRNGDFGPIVIDLNGTTVPNPLPDASKLALLANFLGDGINGTSFNDVWSGVTEAHVARSDENTITITPPALPAYDIDQSETITFSGVPGNCSDSGVTIQTTPSYFTIGYVGEDPPPEPPPSTPTGVQVQDIQRLSNGPTILYYEGGQVILKGD